MRMAERGIDQNHYAPTLPFPPRERGTLVWVICVVVSISVSRGFPATIPSSFGWPLRRRWSVMKTSRVAERKVSS
jgi:hypothetical protein